MSSTMFDKANYNLACDRVAAVLDVTRRFPEAVFNGEPAATTFCEVDAVFGADLWPAFVDLATAHGDGCVYLLVVEPDVNDYVASYGRWPALSLPVTASADDYWDAINDEPRGDVAGALVNCTEVVAFAGNSGTWACWGERSLGIAAFRGYAVPALADWRETHGPFLDAADTLDSYVTPHFRDRVVPADFTAKFMKNYVSSLES